MKKILIVIACFLIATKLLAQDCSQFLYLQKGKTIETTCFNNSGAVMWKIVNYVSDVTNVNGTTVATVTTENFDKDGQSKGKKDVTFKCNGGSFLMDMNSSNGSDNIKFESGSLEYPAGMKVGDHLPDVDMKMLVAMPGRPSREMTSKIIDRQVVSKESVTTPAGTWDALKITYKTSVEMPGMTMPPTTTTQWFVPSVGIVQYKLYSMTVKVTSIH